MKALPLLWLLLLSGCLPSSYLKLPGAVPIRKGQPEGFLKTEFSGQEDLKDHVKRTEKAEIPVRITGYLPALDGEARDWIALSGERENLFREVKRIPDAARIRKARSPEDFFRILGPPQNAPYISNTWSLFDNYVAYFWHLAEKTGTGLELLEVETVHRQKVPERSAPDPKGWKLELLTLKSGILESKD